MNPLRLLRRIKTRVHLALGLAGLAVGIVLGSSYLGLVPDAENMTRQHRAALAETMALALSAQLDSVDPQALHDSLEVIVQRNAGLRSVGVRGDDGALFVATDAHAEAWPGAGPVAISDRALTVPVWLSGTPWGRVELAFEPLRSLPGWQAHLQDPSLKLAGFVFLAGVLSFLLYLHRMLRELDPSRAVPARVRTAYDTLTEGLLVLDRDGRIVLANKSSSSLLGVEEAQLVGRSPSDFGWHGPGGEALDRAALPWRRAMTERNAAHDVALTVTRGDGVRFALRANCSPLLDDRGGLQALVISFQDVTELERRGAALQTAKDEADSANEAKSQFLANMSHEIRTPMTAILGYADLIIGEDGNPAPASLQTDAVRTIRHNGEHLLTVINDILDLSKIEAGKMGVESLPCSPLRIVSEVRELMALRAAASKLVVALEVVYPVPAQITTDPLRLRQILVNLVGNAIKFTPAPPESPGRITIAVEAAAASDGTPRLRFRVTDTGVGLSDALRERLFTPFSQHDASTTRKFGGTGLGLAISHQLAQMLGGSLDAPRPDPGAPRGAVFELLLPISTDARMLDGPEPEQSAAVPAPAAKVRLQGRILLAEDGPDNQRLLQHVLRTAGATVHLAINGTDAVAAARGATEPFDLVLMDMQMPEMDGYEATVALRAAGIRAPIVALTAHAMAGDRERCLAAGCNDYLTKPIDRATLLSACQRWMVAQREAA